MTDEIDDVEKEAIEHHEHLHERASREELLQHQSHALRYGLGVMLCDILINQRAIMIALAEVGLSDADGRTIRYRLQERAKIIKQRYG